MSAWSDGSSSATLLNVRWTDSRGCCQVSGKKKRPERPASVPCRSFEALQPGRGADPRYPLGPPLMLSPVALPGTGALDGISDPFPLADPSGREEIYGPLTDRATDLSTKTRRDRRILSTTSVVFQQCINSRPWFLRWRLWPIPSSIR